jgi:hypothetical protein
VRFHIIGPALLVGFFLSTTATAAGPSKQECVAADDAAQDLRQAGKLRAAREKLSVCASTSCPGPVRDDCAQRVDELNKAQPTIVFAVKDRDGNDMSAVRVSVDGQPIAETLDGSALQVDPGAHTFRFEGASVAGVAKTLVIREGEKERRERVVMGASAPRKTVADGAPADLVPDDHSSRVPTIGYLAFGAGAVGLVVGIVFTGLWVDSKHRGDGECGSGTCDEKTASDFQTSQTTYTAGLGVGYGIAVVGAGVGTIVLLASRGSTKKSVQSSAIRIEPRIGIGWAGIEGGF